MNWTKIHEDDMPLSGEPIDILTGVKILYGYTLEWDNDINYHFESIKTGFVVSEDAVDEWRYQRIVTLLYK